VEVISDEKEPAADSSAGMSSRRVPKVSENEERVEVGPWLWKEVTTKLDKKRCRDL
jgi:hypothetical protein